MDNENQNNSSSEDLSGTNEEHNQNLDQNHDEDTHDEDESSSDSNDIGALKAQIAKLEKHNRDLNRENAKHRNRAKENEKEAKLAQKVALEAKNSVELLKKSLEQQAIKAKLVEESVKAGVNDFSTFERLIDKSSLSVSENGEVSGIQEQIKSLKENKSLASLFETPKPNSTSRGYPVPPVSTETKNDVSKLTGDEYQKAKRALLRSKVKR